MKKTRSFVMILYIFIFTMLTLPVFAQDEDDPGFPVEDPGSPAASIDSWILPMMLLGLVFMFYYYKKQHKQSR